ncbi:MAG: hypothetical protein H6853_03635 [Rhodospirillales bacterium]|nr:MAG: hypothetical protein H6853_03635 [Rhodospirillales bacterium]
MDARPKQMFFIPEALLVAASSYMFFLCFVHTNIFAVSNYVIMACETLFLGLAASYILLVRKKPDIILIAFALLVYFCVLWIFRGGVDLQGPRNILIVLFFFSLGAAVSDARSLNKIFWVVSLLAFAGVLAEYFATGLYLKYVNILDFYVSRADQATHVPEHLKDNLFISGIRTAGRNLLPFLGDHRISSIFLEPVSMGNFAIILGIWGLSFSKEDGKKGLGYLLLSVFFLIACDSRFASILLFILFFVRFVPLMQSRIVLAALPVAVLALLLVHAHFNPSDVPHDDFSGRLLRSGEALWDMSFLNFWGADVPPPLHDMGFAYCIENYGILLVILLWTGFVLLPVDTPQGKYIKAMAAYYAIGILTVSGTSFFAMKTSALLWFMVGIFCVKAVKPALCKKSETGCLELC